MKVTDNRTARKKKLKKYAQAVPYNIEKTTNENVSYITYV